MLLNFTDFVQYGKIKDMQKVYKPVVLVIIDGFGVPQEKAVSTWESASMPNFKELEKNYPFTTLQASGLAVGLPWGESGNSEVGHMTIGAGRIIHNYLPRISSSIGDGTFFQNPALLKAVNHAKTNNSSLHFMGLFSTGTVHAYFEHLYALLELAKRNDLPACLHLFTDGKDAYKNEGAEFYAEFEKYLAENYPAIKIASIIGRSYAMDRNGNWGKTEKAYNLFAKGEGNKFESASEHIRSQYELGNGDDSVAPATISSGGGTIKDNDAVVFFNFREDSVRQMTQAFVDDSFQFFPRTKLENLYFATMTEYDKSLSCFSQNTCPAAFKSAEIENPLAKIVSENGLKQIHIAETEKYAHITYFLNGGQEVSFKGEDRVLVPSPVGGGYDKTPEMSADKIVENIMESLEKYDFIAANFANADMVGHTGNLEATAKAIEKVDECVGKVSKAVLEKGGAMIITADHGNAEEKIYQFSGNKKTKHSLNPVPFFVIGKDLKKETPATNEEIEKKYKTVSGTLSDVAPTVLELLGIEPPPEMTGESLLGKIE